MVYRSKYFDVLVAALLDGKIPSVALNIGEPCTIKGQELLMEKELSDIIRLRKSLARLADPKTRYYFIDVPARRIRGPLCLICLLVHGRLVDLYFVETPKGYCIVAVYSDAAKESFQLIDELQQVPFAGVTAADTLAHQPQLAAV